MGRYSLASFIGTAWSPVDSAGRGKEHISLSSLFLPGEVGILNGRASFARTCQINHSIGWPFLYKVDA